MLVPIEMLAKMLPPLVGSSVLKRFALTLWVFYGSAHRIERHPHPPPPPPRSSGEGTRFGIGTRTPILQPQTFRA